MSSNLEQEFQTLKDRGILASPYRAGRSMTISRHGIVASSHMLASLAGLDILRSGGGAMDAAVATAATLAVVEPMMTGLGGDVFFLYYEASTGKVHGLNGSGRSPRGLLREYFRSREKDKIDFNGWEAVTVPGAVDAWTTGISRFGSRNMAEVLAPAIRYAEEGFPVTEHVGRVWKMFARFLESDSWAKQTYLVNGKAPFVGSIFKSPNLASSLRQIASDGRDVFYQGPIAGEIVRCAEESGGFFTMEDFAEHTSTWVEPISLNYRGYDVYQMPPNGQGIGVLFMLGLLEGYDIASMKHNSPEYLHLLIEAKKLAYADLGRWVADPENNRLPIEGLLSKEYAASRRQMIDPKKAVSQVEPGLPAGSDTVYLTAIDAEGNAASFINSIFHPFGAKIVGGQTGILLQNRGAGFTLESGHLNEYEPGKRPFHTIIPGMVLQNGKLYLSYGLMGGTMQPQGHIQFLLNHLDFGLTIQEAIDAPRFNHLSGNDVRLEHGIAFDTCKTLKKMGHNVILSPGDFFGGSQAVLVDPSTGTFFGASDPRKDGAALGY
ncbi:MAG: gamma-glutamyltransferase [Deltaproteobacteria bacterium]|nr:gamma-glutamyltransferase [Deltaproteobacteria bacterium]MBW2139925.1 gamma-glutamyltransferase [Deltaproteobacteria bacterium]MBW2322390.1 gamma-glutamyltransferase [Deltaproteobacteria bacterium]